MTKALARTERRTALPRLGQPPAVPAWRPDDSALGTLGESVLAALSVTSIQGLINPSYLDLRYRSADPGMKAEAKRMLNYSLAAELATSVLIGFGFRNWIPGAVGAGSSLVYYLLFVHALEAGPPPATSRPM